MNNSKISVRYAKAIFKLAKENNLLDEINKDMQLLADASELLVFRKFQHSPVFLISKKKEIYKHIFKDSVHKNTLSFLNILIANRRETYLKIITKNFFGFYREHFGIKKVVLTTVNKLTTANKNKLIKTLTQLFDSKIELHEETNKNIIGGFKISIDDNQYDATVATKLKKLKKELTTTI